MSSPYSRPLTDPGERTIRVLRLNSQLENTNTGVSGYLKETSLNDPLSYTALSYRWGADPPHIAIKLSSGTVNVTTNGYDALVELCRRGRELNLWMDAICIDQSNDSEKAIQVAMMDQVYSKAEKVIVWLGDSYDDAHQALGWCTQVSHRDAGRMLSMVPSRPNLLDRRMRRQAAIQAWEFVLSCMFCYPLCRKINARS